MRTRPLILLAVCTLHPCLATQLPAFASECAALDRVFAATTLQSPTNETALKILELVAVGRMNTADPGLEAKAGLQPGQLRDKSFKSIYVRLHALRRIGETEVPAALDFLQNLTKDDIEPDPSGHFWPQVTVAIHQARLNRISDPVSQIAFLEQSVNERSAASEWAIQELCDRGSQPSLPTIRASLKARMLPPEREREQTGFCQARMDLLSRNPDRITALGSYLTANQPSPDEALMAWAIRQLDSMNTERADAELKRFSAELETLPSTSDGSRRWLLLAQTRQELRDTMASRPKINPR